MAVKKDEYAQFMRLEVTSSAANTLSFAQVPLGSGLFNQAALIVHRIEYFFQQASLQLMTANADYILAAITGSDQMSTLNTLNPQIYDRADVSRGDLGAAAQNNVFLFYHPVVHDFSGLPGGGHIIPAQDIYIATVSAGLADVCKVSARLWYTIKQMAAADYLELAQRLQVLGTIS